jgi:hypothetical protein
MQMHRIAMGVALAMFVACLGGLAGGASAQDPPQKLSGVAAWNQLVGNSITGKEDGETLVEHYAADGTAKSMRGNEISTGQWALVGETAFATPTKRRWNVTGWTSWATRSLSRIKAAQALVMRSSRAIHKDSEPPACATGKPDRAASQFSLRSRKLRVLFPSP